MNALQAYIAVAKMLIVKMISGHTIATANKVSSVMVKFAKVSSSFISF